MTLRESIQREMNFTEGFSITEEGHCRCVDNFDSVALIKQKGQLEEKRVGFSHSSRLQCITVEKSK